MVRSPHRGRKWLAWAVLIMVAAALLGTPALAPGPPSSPANHPLPPHRPGEILIKFRHQASPSQRQAIRTDLGAGTRRQLLRGIEHLRLGRGVSIEEALERYRRHPHVLYVEPNYLIQVAVLPDDVEFDRQWGLHNRGQTEGTPGADIGAQEGWNISTGRRDVLLAVVDTGIDYTHPDLADNIWHNPGEIPGNGLDDDGNGFVDDVRGWDFVANDADPMDENGHGTHVSGIAGAAGDNGVGVAGVAWKVSLVPLRALDANGFGDVADSIEAFAYAISIGVRIVNNSWVAPHSQALEDAVQATEDADVLMVAAAGNFGFDLEVDPVYPASFPNDNIVVVTTSNDDDRRPFFASIGSASVDLAAPGVNIFSTVLGGSYGFNSGTSMSTPHVSGAAALLMSVAPNLPASSARRILVQTAEPAEAFSGLTVSSGTVHIGNALSSLDTMAPGAVDDLSVEESFSNSLAMSWTATGDDGEQGAALAYDLRIATTPLDEATFLTGTRIHGVPPPGQAGSRESFEIPDLLHGTSYHVALRAEDDWGNAGPVSNVVTATTLPAPSASLTPITFEASLFTGQSVGTVITLHNAGPGTLDWSIPPPHVIGPTGLEVENVAGVFPAAGRLAAGSAQEITVTLDALGLDGGLYDGTVEIESNDPARPQLLHSSQLTVIDAADMRVRGAQALLESTAPYFFGGGQTSHALPITLPVGGGGTLELAANGNFGRIHELATLHVEGLVLGPVGGQGIDCAPTTAGFPLSPDELQDLVADGVVEVVVQNTITVEVLCNINEHTVRLHYRGPFDHIDFGMVRSGQEREIPFEVENRGSLDLTLQLQLDGSGFSIPWTERTVPAGSTLEVPILFAPGAAGPVQGSLVLSGNDPDTPEFLTTLQGVGEAPPVLEINPELLESTLQAGAGGAHTVTLTNAGGESMDFSLELPAEASFLTAQPEAGIIAAGASQDVTVLLDSSGLTSGLHSAVLAVHTNDPDRPVADIVVNLTVLGGPRLVTSGDLDFGSVVVGATAGLALAVSNPGNDPLEIAAVDSSLPDVIASPASLVLMPQDSATITVQFTPSGTGAIDGTLTVLSNDPDSPATALAVSGSGQEAPSLQVEPVEIQATLLENRSESRVVTLSNAGTGELAYVLTLTPAEPAFASLDVSSGLVPPSSSANVSVLLDSTALAPGPYEAELHVTSNDPATPLLIVPVRLTVVGTPDLFLPGAALMLESQREFFDTNETTTHSLSLTVPPAGEGLVELTADGDFGASFETATASVDGQLLGSAGGAGQDCSVAVASFTLDADRLAELAGDGVISFQVQNSDEVAPFCIANLHRVRLSYRSAPDRLSFDPTFVGGRRDQPFAVENRGTASLEVSLGTDTPDFTPSAGSLSIAPGETRMISVTFAPGSAGPKSGNLLLDSNDPDMPQVLVPLQGMAEPAPVLSVTPPALDVILSEGGQSVGSLQLSNDGGNPLEFSIRRQLLPPVFSQGDPDHPTLGAVERTFQLLSPSPEPLSCIVEDDARGHLYGQAHQGDTFYRYLAVDDAWERLTTAPLNASGGCGAALLDDTVYTAYGFDSSALGAYDIEAGRWSMVDNPLILPSANIASDGERFLYIASGSQLLRIDPISGENTLLSRPPFAFTRLGGLRHSEGILYGHRGSGRTQAASYDIAADQWAILPQLSEGALLGGAFNPVDEEYLAYGPNQGQNLYRYSLRTGAWDATTIPFFSVGHGGMGWLTLPVPGVYFVEGQNGTGLARWVTGSLFASVSPSSGIIPPGSSQSVGVTFDGTGLAPGLHPMNLRIASNDPLRPETATPAELTILGTPELSFVQQALTVESGKLYFTAGGRTEHHLTLDLAPIGGATLALTLEGDFGQAGETATLMVEGLDFGPTQSDGGDCAPVTARFDLSAGNLAVLAADGVLDAEVQNAPGVELLCPVNRHTLRLFYNGKPEVDFGSSFLGVAVERSLTLANTGSATLEAHGLHTDRTEFSVTPQAVTLPPGGSSEISLVFLPGQVQAFDGRLILDSNDPNASHLEIILRGTGVDLPQVGVDPPGLQATVNAGNREQQTLRILNTGGGPLEFSVTLESADNGVPPSDYALLVVSSGIVPAGSHAEVPLVLHGQGVPPGEYLARIVVASNDLQLPRLEVPVTLNIVGAANLQLGGEETTQESRQEYVDAGAFTEHAFALQEDLVGPVLLELESSGDFGNSVENAVVNIEGTVAGSAGNFGEDCISWTRSFVVSRAEMEPIRIDGRLEVRVENTAAVDPRCPDNDHIVRLRTVAPLQRLDFGSVIVSTAQGRTILVDNSGSTALEVTSISSTAPEFSTSSNSLVVAPGASEALTVFFSPPSEGTFDAVMLVDSNDPDGVLEIPLSGSGIGAPRITVDPTLLFTTVAQQEEATLAVQISNGGSGPLEFRIEIPSAGDAFAQAVPAMGTVPPGSTTEVGVRFLAGSLEAGFHLSELQILSNDPDTPAVLVQALLSVVGAPDLSIRESLTLQSIQEFSFPGALTRHSFPVRSMPAGSGTLELIVGGDFSDPAEFAMVQVQGLPRGSLGNTGTDCTTASTDLELTPAEMTSFGQSGNLEVVLTNTEAVQPICSDSFHSVALRYQALVQELDFGEVFLGEQRTLMVDFVNQGGEELQVTALGLDDPAFSISGDPFSLGPGASRALEITFRPDQTGPLGSSLAVESNDPGKEALLTVEGIGREPPVLEIVPAQLESEIFQADSEVQTMVLSNTGGSELSFSLEVDPAVTNTYLQVEPSAGTIPAGGVQLVTVTFDAGEIAPGLFETIILATSNDPEGPAVAIPVALTVIGRPVVQLPRERVTVESAQSYFLQGDRTFHQLPITVPPAGDGMFFITADGDFGLPAEIASASAEGRFLTSVGGLGRDCTAGTGVAPILLADLQALAADGMVELEVENSPVVEAKCEVDQHRIRLVYDGEPFLLDFGTVFVGVEKEHPFLVSNSGSGVLEIASAATDSPEVTVIGLPATILPGESAEILAVYRPSTPGPLATLVHLHSNDPGRPVTTIPAQGTAAGPPVAMLEPSSVQAALPPDDPRVRVKTVRLSNTGSSELEWSISRLTARVAAASSWAPEPKGDESRNGDGLLSGPRAARTGGPDPDGYRFRDSDEPDGPLFLWVETARSGTALAVDGDDETSEPVPLGFEFPFYDETFTQLRICTNGWLSFSSDGTQFSNPDALPSTSPAVPRFLLAPFWDDLDLRGERRISYTNDASRFIVQFTGVDRYASDADLTFQVILYPSGRILFQYLSLSGVQDSATVGIQNGDGTAGLLAGYNDGYAHDGLAVEFAPVPEWVRIEPASGVVPVSGHTDMDVVFTSAGLGPGDFHAVLEVYTNDPAHETLGVDAVLHAALVPLDRFEILPRTVKRASGRGSIRMDLQLPPGLDPRDVLLPSVTVNGSPLPEGVQVSFRDGNDDGVEELTLRLDRESFLAIAGESGIVTVLGEVRETTWFSGTSSVRIR